jgi:integrase
MPTLRRVIGWNLYQKFSNSKKLPAVRVVTGLRKSEIRGLRWQDFDGWELSVNRSIWNGIESEPKTRRSRAPIPVVRQLAEALESHSEKHVPPVSDNFGSCRGSA